MRLFSEKQYTAIYNKQEDRGRLLTKFEIF